MVSINAKLQSWQKYSARYGVIHAIARLVGTRIPFTWPLLAPIVTRGYREAWIESPGRKILNLGGGDNCLEGCLTADLFPRSDTYVDCRRPLPFEDTSVDGIFCEEMIEHIARPDGVRLLRECWRVLKPGAVIRLTTPDLDWFCNSLLLGTINCETFNDIFYRHEHLFLYSRHEIQTALEASGFVDIRQSKYRDSASLLGYLDSHPARYKHSPDISQYVEARRPV